MKLLDYLARRAERSEEQCHSTELSFLDHNTQAKLLDLGCADGSFTQIVAQRIGTHNAYGIDVDTRLAKQAKQKGIDAKCSDLNKQKIFDREMFDVVVASHIIEHLCDTDTFIKEIYDVLKPRGYLVIATPNLAALPNILLLMFGKQPTIAEVSDVALVGTWSPRKDRVNRVGPAHRRIFTKGALLGLLRHYGFAIERCVMVGSILPVPSIYASNIVVKARKWR